jgi:lysophospholipase L1-like esterase
MTKLVSTTVAVLLVACGLLVATGQAAARQSSAARWITAWATSQQALGTAAISNATVRLIARVTAPGQAIRLRLDNTFGTTPLVIGAARAGTRALGAALVAGSSHPVRFGGAVTVTIPPGGSVVSDEVPMAVLAGQDVAVSLYVPGSDVRPSQHAGALVTSYLSANGSGDVSADEARTPFSGTTTSMFWLKSIDVLSTYRGAIVAFGDSITDGTCSSIDANNRWVDMVSLRMDLDGRIRKAIVNEGIAGNTISQNVRPGPDSPPGLDRFDRDVLSHHGVTDVIVFIGTNDIRREATASQVIAGLEEIVGRVKARKARVFGATIIPRHNVAPSGTNSGWNPAKTQIRNDVNAWIRSKGRFDGVIDFDRAVRDPREPDRILPVFNCDDIHPSVRGYYEMARSVGLHFFK